MTDRFRLMFVVRFPQQLAYLNVTGVDFNTGSLFSVLLYSPNDKVIIDHNTSHYPKDLINYLDSQKELIDQGFYDIRTWEMTVFDDKVKERKDLLKADRGTKKWTSLMLPEHRQMLEQMEISAEKVEKPVLDEYECEEIDRQIGSSLETHKPLIFKVYQKGNVKYRGGIVVKVDPIHKRIEIKTEHNRVEKISISEVVGVEVL
ncbi:YolD-like family protein [Anaerobacillus sp. MEB173]|uniref:YolD-like family protein n=1 Tax=Anaerobacillus sp. MEB173 TaxID=3383345 RepID=UPI003F8FB427